MIREKIKCFDFRRVSVRLSYLVHILSHGSVIAASIAKIDSVYTVWPSFNIYLSSIHISVERGEIESQIPKSAEERTAWHPSSIATSITGATSRSCTFL